MTAQLPSEETNQSSPQKSSPRQPEPASTCLRLRRGGIILTHRLGRRGRLRRALVPPRHLLPLPPLRVRAGV